MKFRKKPVVIEATQWFKNGDHPAVKIDSKSLGMAKREMEKCVVLCSNCHRIRHWNEIHPCKPDIFEATYERIEE